MENKRKHRVAGQDIFLTPIQKGGMTVWVGEYVNSYGEKARIELDEFDLKAEKEVRALKKQKLNQPKALGSKTPSFTRSVRVPTNKRES